MWLAAFVLVAVSGAIVYATYFLPVDHIRTKIEMNASDALKQTVRIDGLALDPLSGFELSGIHVDVEGTRAIDLDRVLLKYRLLPLLNMKFVVHEVVIADATIDVRVEDLLAGLETADDSDHAIDDDEHEDAEHDADSDAAAPRDIPSIPLAVELHRFAVSNANVMIVLHDDLSVSTTGLNVNVAAVLGRDNAQLTGTLSIAELATVLDAKRVTFPLNVDWNIAFDFDTETLTVDHVTFGAGSALTATVRGTVADVLRTRRVDFALHDATIDIEALRALIHDVLPETFAGMAVAGTIHPSLQVGGQVSGDAFDGHANGGLSIRDFAATVPRFQAELNPTHIAIEVPQIVVTNNMADTAALSVAIESGGASFAEHALDALDLRLEGTYAATGEVATTLSLDGEAVHVAIPDVGLVTVPVALALNANGNVESLDLTVDRLAVDLGSMLHVAIEGTIGSATDGSGTRRVDLSADVQPDLAQLLALVPGEWLSGLRLMPSDTSDSMLVKGSAVLDQDHLPQSAQITSRLALHSLGVAVSEPQAAVTVDGVNVSVDADYLKASGAVSASVKSTIGLSKLSQGGNRVSVGRVGIDLGANVSANLSQGFELERMIATNTMKVRIKDVGYTTPALAAGLDSLHLSLRARQDLIAGRYELEQLTVDARPVFLVNGNGTYHVEPQTFAVHLGVPKIDLHRLITTASGKRVPEHEQAEVSGTMGLSVHASGRVPDEEDIAALSFPVSMHARFHMKDVDVRWQGHFIDNARAKGSVSFLPGEHDRAVVMTELRMNAVGLPEALPIRHVMDPFVSVRLDSTDFDEIQLKHVTLGMRGAEVNVGGTISGFRKALIEKPVAIGRLLEQVFAHITTDASVELAAWDEVLHPHGMTASGTAGVRVDVLKKDRGPMTASVTIDSRDVHAELEGIRVVDVDGSIAVRKTLQWMSEEDRQTPPAVFHPADRVSALRVHSDPHDMFSFRALKAGSITADNFSSHIEFDGSHLKIQNLALNLLNGGIGGDVVISTGDALGLDARIQLSAIDMNALLDEQIQGEGDARVTGTLVLRAFLDDARQSIDLGSMELLLNVTAIGKDVLDRVLLFLDPQESNPMIATARSNVSLGNPSHVILRIAKGVLGMEIGFQEGLISGFSVDRIPVSSVKNLRVMDALVPGVKQLAGAVELIEAQWYGVDEHETFVVR